MEMINQQVFHKKFGIGKIKSCEGRVMEVSFAQYGSRSFVYPEAFERFLTACDPSFAQSVAQTLKSALAENDQRESERRAEIEQIAQRMKPDKVAAPKKAAPKKPRKKTEA